MAGMTDTDDLLDTAFMALSDRTRRAIVSRLLEGDCTVSELADPFQMSLAAVSKHLTILNRAGIVTQRREGRVKWCRLEVDALREAAVWMAGFGRFDGIDLDRLEERLSELGIDAGDMTATDAG